MGAFGELQEFIYRDVKNENESKRTAVIVRCCDVIMCLYYFIIGIMMMADRHVWIFWFSVPCLLLYILSFRLTYIDKTKFAVCISLCTTLLWILLIVLTTGWGSGTQQFVFPIIIMIFALFLWRVRCKVLLTMVIWGIRTALYFHTVYVKPSIIIPGQEALCFLILNAVTVCLLMTVILALYTVDSVQMEQKLVEYNRKLHKISRKDPLTGLYNRRGIYEYLEECTKAYKATEIYNIAIAIGDIDFFKKVNDKYGHDAGDEVLRKVSAKMEEMMEHLGSAGRWGGEEFLLVFYDINGDEAAERLEELRREIKGMIISYQGQEIQVTITFGLAEYDATKEIEETIKRVDKKLYIGKESGRDRIVY